MLASMLMCAPSAFEISYEINPWMHGQIATGDRSVAMRQWARLHAAIERVATVHTIEPVTGLPDMVFVANAGFTLDRRVVVSRFANRERQGESAHFARWFAQAGFDCIDWPDDIVFEGAGDALLDRHAMRVWMGHGHRTDVRAAPLLAARFDIDVVPLELIDPRFYHVDTCLCPLAGGELMYYPGAFSEQSQRAIRARVPPSRRIEVGERDAMQFACNAVSIERAVFMHRASDALRATLAARGYTVHTGLLGEFLRAGGSAKCLTLRLDETRSRGRLQRVA
jgi:N-dimethylarginine dimethylaminohydrolase